MSTPRPATVVQITQPSDSMNCSGSARSRKRLTTFFGCVQWVAAFFFCWGASFFIRTTQHAREGLYSEDFREDHLLNSQKERVVLAQCNGRHVRRRGVLPAGEEPAKPGGVPRATPGLNGARCGRIDAGAHGGRSVGAAADGASS